MIMFDEGKDNPSVFYLLEQACIHLCKVSFKTRQAHHTQKKPPSSVLYERFIYNTMVWGGSTAQHKAIDPLITLLYLFQCLCISR